ncbi:MAG: hypothetical protein P8Z77_03200, partial [Candidatus Thiodiazotropha sp.]
EKIPESYVDAVGACIEEMPKQFEGYGAKWEFVLNRVKGLGKRADKLGSRIVELMNTYCSDDLYDVGQLIEEFAGILYELGLEEPPKLIRDHAENDQYHNIENYGAWASKVPTQRWETFVERRMPQEPRRWCGCLRHCPAWMKTTAEFCSAHSCSCCALPSTVATPVRKRDWLSFSKPIRNIPCFNSTERSWHMLVVDLRLPPKPP